MELVAHKNFLMAVINEAILHDRPRVTLKSDMIHCELFEIDCQNARLSRIINRSEMEEKIDRLKQKLTAGSLRQELPDYSDLKDSLQSSLLMPPENLHELIKELEDIERRKLDPYRFPRQKLLAIDTNIAYNRLLSRMILLMDGGPLGRINPSSIQIIVPSLVEEEITNSVSHKYRPQDISALERELRYKEAGSYINCLLKRGRKAMNAQTEINILRELYSVLTVRGGKFLDDKERRDEEIIRTISQHASDQKCDVLFLTADDKARAHAYSARVPSLLLKYPHEVPTSLNFDPWLLPEFLYDLAISFGILSLKGLGVKIQGVWGGKNADHYLKEMLRFVIEDGSALADHLKRDYNVLKKLKDVLYPATII